MVSNRPLAVIALGGNALLPSSGPITVARQREQAAKVAATLAPLSISHRLVVTHGSGPQVGLLAAQALSGDEFNDATLDIVDAEVEGMLGYLLMQSLSNAFAADVVTLLTQVVVDPNDAAFLNPTKPIGRAVSADRAQELKDSFGWTMAKSDQGFRRLVASPAPLEIVEFPAIRTLTNAGTVPICAGGGGIPVVRTDYELSGIAAVVDKDAVSSLLATLLHADLLVLLTDVDGLWTDWKTPQARLVRQASAAWAKSLALPAGSMGPKVEACIAFTEATGKPSYIGNLQNATELVGETKGTRVDCSTDDPTFYP